MAIKFDDGNSIDIYKLDIQLSYLASLCEEKFNEWDKSGQKLTASEIEEFKDYLGYYNVLMDIRRKIKISHALTHPVEKNYAKK